MIDLHNDTAGKLHVSRPDIDLDSYLAKMKRLEAALRKHTWFSKLECFQSRSGCAVIDAFKDEMEAFR